MSDLINFIPFGKENAISREELCRLTGMNDRAIREIISQLRREYCILNNQDGRGYYRPLVDETKYVQEYIRQETRRAKSIFWSLEGARNWMEI